MAHPDALVIDIAGEASILMNIQEMSTLAQYHLPVKVVILNNHYMGMVRQWQEFFHGGRYADSYMDSLPDFVKLAESFGAMGLRTTKPEELDDLFAARRHLVGVQEQQIDIRIGRHLAAPVAADGNQAQPVGRRGIGFDIYLLRRELMRDGDDLIDQEGRRRGRRQAVRSGVETAADFRLAIGQGGLEHVQGDRAQRRRRSAILGHRGQPRGHRAPVDNVALLLYSRHHPSMMALPALVGKGRRYRSHLRTTKPAINSTTKRTDSRPRLRSMKARIGSPKK